MKKLIAIGGLALALMLTGCEALFGPWVKYEDIYLGLPKVSSLVEAWSISSRVVYTLDGSKDTFKEPRDTYATMKGDCEDIAALLLAILINSELHTGYIAIINTGITLHAVVELDGVGGPLLEAQTVWGYWFGYPVVDRYSMQEYVEHRSLIEATIHEGDTCD